MAVPNRFDDPYWQELSTNMEKKLELPSGMLHAIVVHGERSNNDQVSEAGAKTPYQITPQTRKLAIDKWGIDPYLSPENAAEVAGNLLKESLQRNKGDIREAVGEYHGGTDRNNWGPRTMKYIERVGSVIEAQQVEKLSSEFSNWFSQNKKPSTEEQTTAKPEDKVSASFGEWLKNKPKEQAKPEEPSTIAQLKDVVTGELRQTPETQSLPEWVTMPELNDIASIAGWKTAIGTLLSNPQETAQIIQANSPGTQVRQDEKGNYILTSAKDGKDYVIPPGLTIGDLPRILGGIAAFSPAGRATTILGQGAVAGATQAGIEASQAATGGEFNPADVAMVGAGGAAIPAISTLAEKAVPPIVQAVQKIKSNSVGKPEVPVVGGSQTAGAMEVPIELQRKQMMESLPVPILNPTEAQLTRNQGAQQFEKNVAKQEIGAPIRETYNDHNAKMAQNFDAMFDKTEATTTTLRDAGIMVTKAIQKKADSAMAKVRDLYKKASNSEEAKTVADTSALTKVLNNEVDSIDPGNLYGLVKNKMNRMGVISEENGVFLPKDLELKRLYEIRTFINKEVNQSDAREVRKAALLKNAIDQTFEEKGGTLYKQASQARRQYAREFENKSVIKNLISYKKGTEDRKVAFEDVFNHSILNGSLDDMRHLRRVLQTQGDEGKQAWNELRGQTIQHFKDAAFSNNATNTRGDKVISAPKLEKEIAKLDKDGKLEYIFGKEHAQTLRDVSDVANTLFTSPQGSINSSDTATILAAMLDGGIASISGLPLPILSGLKMLSKRIKNKKLKAQMDRALTYHKTLEGK